MIALTQDKTALRKGFDTVFINPDDVSAVMRNDNNWDEDNKTIIVLKNGMKIPVQDYPSSVCTKLGI